MSNFDLLPDKTKAVDLKIDDYVIVNDQFWHVINNFRVLGGGRRMLMLAYHTHRSPEGYFFHEVGSDERFEVFQERD